MSRSGGAALEGLVRLKAKSVELTVSQRAQKDARTSQSQLTLTPPIS